MKIIFKDFFENEITEAQAVVSEEYSKIFVMPGGLVKKEELYSDSRLKYIYYYKNPTETEDEAKAQLLSCPVPFNICERLPYFDFTIIKVNSYTGNQLTQKWKFLADADDFIMCIQEITIDSGEPLYAQTTKYLGKYSDDPEPNYCKFNYDESGQFTYCDYNYVRDYESDLIETDRLPIIKERFNITDELYNYYLTAELLPRLK